MAELQEELRVTSEKLQLPSRFERYELIEPYKGTRPYRIKTNQILENEPIHYICPNCKGGLNKISVLQELGHLAVSSDKVCGQVFDIGPPISLDNGRSRDPYSDRNVGSNSRR